MKRFLLYLVATLLFAPACRHHKIIPDSRLAQIFHDIFLTNAYIQEEHPRVDSLLLYEPVFARYGYTAEDVQYTIGNFSKRKSARLGDVVERAIDLLEEEGLRLEHEVAILDTVDNVARRLTRRTLFTERQVHVRALKDTARLRLTIPVTEPGDYTVSLDYLIDSADRNNPLRAAVWLEGEQEGVRRQSRSMALARHRTEHFEQTLAADTSVRRLVVDFWNLEGRRKRERPDIRLSDIRITLTLPVDRARDSLYRQQLNLHIFADDFLAPAPTDSLS